jgi:hypothetical protein
MQQTIASEFEHTLRRGTIDSRHQSATVRYKGQTLILFMDHRASPCDAILDS